jgi:class 3 adenylate cyclase/TolB-like protein
MSRQRRHLAAILFTDIVGYTAMMQQDESKAVAVAKRYLSVLQRSVSEYDGEILNDYGDGSLCSLPSATDAVRCAIKIQEELKQEPAVPLRIGLHIGEIFFEDGKVFGDGVNVASRVQSLGQANTILFSSEINNKIRNNPDFKSVSLGKFEFKNVDDPVEVFALANDGFTIPKREQLSGKLKETKKKSSSKKMILAAAIVVLLVAAGFLYKNYFSKTSDSNKEKTIAILPFKNISINKEENEPFCVGVALELQKKVELLGALIPIAPQSVEKFRDTKLSISEIAKGLGGISYILQGNVLRDKNRFKIFISLIDVISGKEKWSKEYSGEVEDIFVLQENIAQKIASEMQVSITPDEQNRIARISTTNTKALDLYNEAQLNFVKFAYTIYPDEASYKNIQTLCDKAIELDSLFADVYVLKAKAYGIVNERKGSFTNNYLDTVFALCQKALAIDKNSIDGLVTLGQYYNQTGKAELALKQFEKAIGIGPNNFFANWAMGNQNSLYHYDPIQSIKYLKKALKLDPLSVWTPVVYNDLSFQYLNICDFEKTKFYANKVLETQPNSKAASDAFFRLVLANSRLGNADTVIALCEKWKKVDTTRSAAYFIGETYCYLKNDCSKAVKYYEEDAKLNPINNLHRWGIALWKTGKKEEALRLMNHSIAIYKKLDSLGRINSAEYDMAGVYAFMGDKKTAYEILNAWAQMTHWPWGSPYLIKVDPLFDNLRNDKEFKEIVQKALDEKNKLREKIKKLEDAGEL